MKFFNIAVVAAWLIVFGASLHTTPGNMSNESASFSEAILNNIVWAVNEEVTSYCSSCGMPDAPIIEKTMVGNTEQIHESSTYALSDNRMTQEILRSTFAFVVVFVCSLNLFFLLGKWRGDGTIAVGRVVLATKIHGFVAKFEKRRAVRISESGDGPPENDTAPHTPNQAALL